MLPRIGRPCPTQILILHTPKGGSGKSTAARELAVAASGTMQVALADVDPQGTTSGWYQRQRLRMKFLSLTAR